MKKWMYKGNIGVLAINHEIDELKDYFTQNRPEDLTKFEQVHFGVAIAMVKEAQAMALIAEMNKEPEQEEQKTEEAQPEQEEQKKQRGRPKKE